MNRKTIKYGTLMILLGNTFFFIAAEEKVGWIKKAKTYLKEKINTPLDDNETIFRMHVLGDSKNKKVENPRTDSARREDKDFTGLDENTTNTSTDFPEVNNNIFENGVIVQLLQIAMEYNKHIFFFCVAAGTLLAVIFPQQTKSMLHGTGSKIKRLFEKIRNSFSFNKNKTEEIKTSNNQA